MAYKPISNEYLQSGLQQYVQSQPAPVEEKPLWERAKDDIVNTVSNYFEGARQGIQEQFRQEENIRQIANVDEYGNASPKDGYTQQEVDAQKALTSQAQANLANETILPTMAFTPLAVPAIGAMLGNHAVNTYNETGSGLEALKAVTIQPAIDMYNNPNLSQEFKDRPVSTLASGAMAVGQAVLPVVGARYGVKKVGELKNDLVSHVESRLNEQLNELTDNPPLKNTGIQGLDALDQLDAPNQGFRAATKDELKQTVIEQLEQIKAQKFDQANQESYFNNMRQQELESNALQAKKNEIAGSVLMSPLDRMEVGADLPIKRTLGGQGKVLGERTTSNIILPNKPVAGNLILPKQIPTEPFLRDAISFIDQRTNEAMAREMRNAVRQRDFAKGASIAEQMGNTKLAEMLRNVDVKNNPRESFSAEDIARKSNYDKLSENDMLVADLVEHHAKNSGLAPDEILQELKNERNRMLDNYKRQIRKQIEDSPTEKYNLFDEQGNVTTARSVKTRPEFADFEASQFHKKVKGKIVPKKYWTELSNSEKNQIIEQSARKHLREGFTDSNYGDIVPSEAADHFNRLESAINGFQEAIPKISASTRPEIWETKRRGDGHTESLQQAAADATNIVGEARRTTEQEINNSERQVKLNAGLDPTFGRFDNVNLGAKALEATMKAKDRIINGVDDGRIIDNNPKWYNKGLKNLPPVKKLMDRAYQQVFDSLDPIAGYDKEVYKSARLANGSAIGKAESMIKNQNNPNSFENIVKPVQNRIDDFAEYMVAKRAKELHATGTMTGVSNAKINEILSKAPADFADVQKQLTSYSDKLVEMLVDSGMISEEHAINMFNKYESYAPMMQAFDGEQISKMFQDKGDLGKPIKNIEGSDSKVVNPIESILKNTYTFNMIAETNKVRQQIASLAESFPDEIKILKSGESAEKGTGTFDFFVNGKKQTMQLEPRLFEAIASMDSQQAGIVVSVLSKPASWLRAGATISPEFMAKNLIRDTIGASIVGKGFVPFVDSARGLKSAWKKDADYWRYKEEGGALGHLTGLDRDYMQEMVDNYRKKSNVQKLSAAFNPKTWLDVLRKGQELSEDATRIGYYKKRLSKGDSPHEAAFEARDLLDFGRSGNYTREANKVVAFLNASLQGSDKLARSFKERPLETAANTMKYLILPSMAVWYMQEKSGQKDKIKELPRYVRDMFWVIPTGDTLIRIPKPFEPGMLFATGTERTMEAMFGDSKTPYKGYAESLIDVTLPNLLPTGLIPLGEWWANKSFFTGQAIVPNREQDLPEAMQYGPYTTNVAKTIGEKTGQSPRKIDNAIRGLTGGMGTTVTSAIDSLTGRTGTVRPAKSLSDMPVVKAFIADPRKGQQSTQDFYDELDKYTKKHQAESIRNVKMTTTEKKNYTALNNANTALKALNKEERKVLESNTLSPEAKKQKINKLVDAQSKLVQASLKRIK